jgi:hypothetical protein
MKSGDTFSHAASSRTIGVSGLIGVEVVVPSGFVVVFAYVGNCGHGILRNVQNPSSIA